MGTVKDFNIMILPGKEYGLGIMKFSDRFSVFDYGVMPDTIEGKGAALCIISAYFFEKVKEKDIVRTHYISLLVNRTTYRTHELYEPTDEMLVRVFRVFKPEIVNGKYDYTPFKLLKRNYVLPIEVIYRNYLPEGSSVFRRLEKGELKLEDLGLEEMPKPGEKLKRPIVDFSTKYEDYDRYISKKEAMEIANLSEEEMTNLIETTLKINNLLTKEFYDRGIIHEDGKLEFALDGERNLRLVDALGTPDECRLRFEGLEISKELLRIYYRNTEWYKKLQAVKGKENWRKLVGTPPRLPEELKEIVSELYKSTCNEVLRKRIFDVPHLKEVVRRAKEYVEVNYG